MGSISRRDGEVRAVEKQGTIFSLPRNRVFPAWVFQKRGGRWQTVRPASYLGCVEGTT